MFDETLFIMVMSKYKYQRKKATKQLIKAKNRLI